MLNKLLVEFAGTLFFLFVIIATGQPLAIGAALYVAILSGGKISGGHFNPAVSIMMAANGKLSYTDMLLFIASQVLGGLCALGLFTLLRL